MIANRAN